MRRLACALLLAGMLAGCASTSVGPAPPQRMVVEGWLLDEAIRPVAGGLVAAQGWLDNATSGEDGRFLLTAPPGLDLYLTVRAPGFLPTTRFLPAGSGLHQWLNVTLERLPSDAPRVEVEDWQGFLECAATVVVNEDPSNPHEHQGVRCSDHLPDELDRNVWRYRVPPGASGLVVEVAWEPGTHLARSLVLKAEAESSGEVVGFLESPSILRLQVAASQLERLAGSDGGTLRLTILPGAGAGSHEHGAAGLFVEQPFTIYASAFFHQPADPNYSIADAGP